MPVVNDYTALLGGDYWGGIEVTNTPVVITYSFPTSAPAYDINVAGFNAATVNSFQAFDANEQADTRAALAEFAAAGNITFVEVAPGQGDINFQIVDLTKSSYGNPGGIAFYPFGDWNGFTYPSFSGDLTESGDVFMNSAQITGDSINKGTLRHEIGHALGLKHPTQVVKDDIAGVTHDQVLSSDDPTRTVMATVGDSTNGTNTHLLPLDNAAIAAIYGTGQGQVIALGQSASGTAGGYDWTWDGVGAFTQTDHTAGTVRGTSLVDTMTARAAGSSLYGLAGNDVLVGQGGADYLDGGPGADHMTGGSGDDRYAVDNPGDVVTEAANGGTDTVYAFTSYTVPTNVEIMSLFGTGLTGNGTAAGETIYGDPTYATTLHGNGGNDFLYGGAAVDTITGDDGNDIIDGHGGADTMTGGTGNDTYYVDDAGDKVIEAAGQGIDTVYASVSYTLPANVEILGLLGTANINATGNTLDNTIYGNAGNNTIDGGAGADTMYGGAGNDGYVVGNAGDKVIENTNEGYDTVYSTISYALTANVEALTLLGTANINATGNELANTIYGNAGNNVIDGGAGADTMYGGAGDDTYYVDDSGDKIGESTGQGYDTVYSTVTYSIAGIAVEALTLTGTANIDATGNSLDNVLTSNLGVDTLTGGIGNDTYYVNNSADTVVEAASQGIDTIYASVTYTMPVNVENMTLTGTANINATGNALNNTIYGNAGNNTIDGGAGADTMTGGAGNDTYVVGNAGDTVIENANEGTDTIFTTVSYVLPANVEVLTLGGTGSINGTGNELANTLTSNAGDNVLTGGGGADVFAFKPGFGHDTITDFVGGTPAGHDFVRIDHTVFANYADVMAHAQQVGGDVVITHDPAETLTLQGVTLGALASSDFLFT